MYFSDNLNSAKEFNQNSRFLIRFYKKKDYRILHSKDISSYLLWSLGNKKWIKTKNNLKVKPSVCSLSKTITIDLSPFIEIPLINYKDYKFKGYNISREDLEHLLMKVGVAVDLGKFSTETIYSILLKLPELDKTGDKARVIHKQILENKTKDQIDKSSEAYINFFKNGKVLAKLNGQKAYYPINEAYYIENRTFCQEIINQFPILDLDKRAGKDKVKNILGVKPLEDISFKLKGQPKLYDLNIKFQQDFEDFKPYVYAYRLEKDTKHIQLNNIKKIKIDLCTRIDASYIFNGEEKSFNLQTYEHIFIGKKKTVFLKIEPNLYNSIYDLKKDMKFCEAISEIVSGVLKVEEIRSNLRDLYLKEDPQRKVTLSMDLDDDNLNGLNRSRQLLGISSDLQQDFWYVVLKATKPSLNIPEFDSDKRQKIFISKSLKLKNEFIEELFKNLDYDDINLENNLELILKLFKKIKLDVNKFNVPTHVLEDF